MATEKFIDLPLSGAGLPTGGTAGQVLEKVDSTDFNATWASIGTGTGNILSINGDTTAAQVIAGGTNITVGTVAGTTTIDFGLLLGGNSFVFTNPAGDNLVSYGNWSINPTTFYSNVDNFFHPDNLGESPFAYNWNINV